MEKKTFSKEEMHAMVADLETQFQSIMKSEKVEAQLSKSEDESKDEDKKEEKVEEKKEEPKAEAAPSEEKKEEPKAEDEKKEDESHGYDDEDMEEMSKMYSSMSKGELKAHKENVEKCWMAKCGEMTQSMTKSEVTQEVVKSEDSKPVTEESTLLKSELETTKKENEELKKNIDGLVSALNSYVTNKAPVRKAITNIEFVKKSEEVVEEKTLSKSEINTILAKKSQDPKLSSQDREAINQFYLTNAGVDRVKHLLKQ